MKSLRKGVAMNCKITAALLVITLVSVAFPEIHRVTVSGTGFDPENMIVPVDDTVWWVNADSVAHDVSSDIGVYLSTEQCYETIAPGDSFSFLPYIHRYYNHSISQDTTFFYIHNTHINLYKNVNVNFLLIGKKNISKYKSFCFWDSVSPLSTGHQLSFAILMEGLYTFETFDTNGKRVQPIFEIYLQRGKNGINTNEICNGIIHNTGIYFIRVSNGTDTLSFRELIVN
jgi:plastocyanin